MTKPTMTGHQADALARFLVALRPGQRRWTQTAVVNALYQASKQRTDDTETLARAAIRAALTPSIVSPEVIPMPGAHWESVDHTPIHEPKRATRCRCGGIHMAEAPCQPVERASFDADAARAVLAAAKAARQEAS